MPHNTAGRAWAPERQRALTNSLRPDDANRGYGCRCDWFRANFTKKTAFAASAPASLPWRFSDRRSRFRGHFELAHVFLGPRCRFTLESGTRTVSPKMCRSNWDWRVGRSQFGCRLWGAAKRNRPAPSADFRGEIANHSDRPSDDVPSCDSRSTGRSIPFQVYKKCVSSPNLSAMKKCESQAKH